MKRYSILLNPLARGAFFDEFIEISKLEIRLLIGVDSTHRRVGQMDYLDLSCDESKALVMVKASSVLGIFEVKESGMIPLDISECLDLPLDFIFGAKYRGKTNELFTKFMLNVGVSLLNKPHNEIKVLDPMCGRGTTLMWACALGMTSKGIEKDPKALADIRMNLKKWTKLYRVKHSLKEGFVGKANRSNMGKFLDFKATSALRVTSGDASQAYDLLAGERFDVLVTDIPYGVQHMGADKSRDPSETLASVLPAWGKVLKKDGVMVIGYNRNIPRRARFEKLATEAGLLVDPLSAGHRMSESIVRDIIVLRHNNDK